SSPGGWNNTLFPHVAMPHALYELQGSQRLKEGGDEGHEEGASEFEIVIPGKLTPAEYDVAMADLTNFLVYLAEPAKMVRYKMGFWVILLLAVLSVLTYMLKKEYWRDVH
ncbi:MAG: cytochrome c1, partial [Gammaproteobacteria bacterium]|nr:cytochrome c1 [Gammaproteobacteria bacterium]